MEFARTLICDIPAVAYALDERGAMAKPKAGAIAANPKRTIVLRSIMERVRAERCLQRRSLSRELLASPRENHNERQARPIVP